MEEYKKDNLKQAINDLLDKGYTGNAIVSMVGSIVMKELARRVNESQNRDKKKREDKE